MTTIEESSVAVVTFEADGLGNRSYLLHDGEVAVVVDPQRDPTVYVEEAERLGVGISHVLETHIHNDFVSGGLALSRAVEAEYVVPSGEYVDFARECVFVGDEDTIVTGSLSIKALATPGHTPHHLAYVVEGGGSTAPFACTGGSVVPGGVGRTDLFGVEQFPLLTRAQWTSARRILTELEGQTRLLPTHGFGSFCSVAASDLDPHETLTVATEATRNPAFGAELADFVASMQRSVPPMPEYYRAMGGLNRAGQSAPLYGPIVRLAAADLDRLLDEQWAVADLRSRRTFASQHRKGTLNIEFGPNLATYLGWIVPFSAPYTLIGESEDQIELARRHLAQIGREFVSGYLVSSEIGGQLSHSYPVGSFEQLATVVRRGGHPQVLDVRHQSEWDDGHLAIARGIPLPDLGRRRDEINPSEAVWVHCAAGFRAAVAASQLSAWNYHPVLIDDNFSRAAEHGLSIVNDPERPSQP